MEQYSKEIGRGYTVRVVDAKNPQVGLSNMMWNWYTRMTD